MNNSLKIVSLFDGISCGRVAFERAGISVGSYSAFEIDKYAKSVSRYNHPDIEQCGNVLEADFSRFIGSDFVIGGSPCTVLGALPKLTARLTRTVSVGSCLWDLLMPCE